MRAFLRSNRIPLVGEVEGRASFEGADALWLRPNCVLIGVGERTNNEGAAQVAEMLSGIGVACLPIPAPPRAQHLLDALNFVSGSRAAVRSQLAERAHALLSQAGVTALAFKETGDVVVRGCLNFVALREGLILAPKMGVESRAHLAQAGAFVRTSPVSEYLVCAGGIGCATGILHREAVADESDPCRSVTVHNRFAASGPGL